uniref:Uncharacterized protein n=1 Tax=Anguilla anguilla TaxID=7936 RepID=A0A0E9RRM1_ANGAN
MWAMLRMYALSVVLNKRV